SQFNPLRLPAAATSPEFCAASLWGGGGRVGVLRKNTFKDEFANNTICNPSSPQAPFSPTVRRPAQPKLPYTEGIRSRQVQPASALPSHSRIRAHINSLQVRVASCANRWP